MWLCRAVTSMPPARSALMTGLTSLGDHHKVASDRSVAVSRRLEAYAGRNAEGAGRRNRHAVHRHRIAARDSELIDAAIGLAFDADDLVELRGIEINRWWGSRCRRWGKRRLAFGKCRADGSRQFDRIAVTADMHVEGGRTGAQQVVMDCGDVEAVLDHLRHDGFDLGFQQHQIAHHHDFVTHGLECDPAAERQSGFDRDTVERHLRSVRGNP